MNFDINLKDG